MKNYQIMKNYHYKDAHFPLMLKIMSHIFTYIFEFICLYLEIMISATEN